MSNFGYSEASPFVRLFKTASRVKIVDTLLRKHYSPLTTKEIAEYADIDRSSVTRNLPVLQEIGVVKEADKIGNARRYQIDKSSQIAKALAAAQEELFKHAPEIPHTGLETSQERAGASWPPNEAGEPSYADEPLDDRPDLFLSEIDADEPQSGFSKQELVHLHALLADIATQLQTGGEQVDLTKYDELGVRPTSVQTESDRHKEAIEILAEEITESLGEPISSTARIADPEPTDSSDGS